jgi:hypothetical protein
MGRVQIVTEEERFPFTPEGCEPTVFGLRRLTAEAIEEIDARHRKLEFNKRTGAREWAMHPSVMVERALDIYDYVIRDWTDVVDGDGQPVPCTRAMKGVLPGAVRLAIIEQADAANASGLGRRDAPDPTPR